MLFQTPDRGRLAGHLEAIEFHRPEFDQLSTARDEFVQFGPFVLLYKSTKASESVLFICAFTVIVVVQKAKTKKESVNNVFIKISFKR